MRLVTPNEAAYVLSCQPGAVYKWMEDGKIPFLEVTPKGKKLIDLAGFLKSKNIDPLPYFEVLEARRNTSKQNAEDEE